MRQLEEKNNVLIQRCNHIEQEVQSINCERSSEINAQKNNIITKEKEIEELRLELVSHQEKEGKIIQELTQFQELSRDAIVLKEQMDRIKEEMNIKENHRQEIELQRNEL